MEAPVYRKIAPLRYVYHVSYASCRDSIEKEGLLANYSKMNEAKCVFAHNAGYPDMRWYPFCFDESFYWEKSVDFDSRDLDFLYFMLKYGYDFWQIDTRKAGIQWFIDKHGMDDFYGGINYPFLITAFDDVPRYAMRLFNFHKTPLVLRGEGVAHVEGYFRAA
ncbi:hypothetical protein SAMN06265375_101443 [Muriicola jejuensis]|uniref:Uncharacterized protein n=1 Tax=Muriicola jejuensis TaxID=504488 RepID=A0A6P0UIK6_9FLAO|nr:hypothetical protein [Muriicola jejuensis]NER10026.1 hypothetical protein [Muriicola jejuensis]SMP03647.1 hypothetical protein SAMN06265375_101443 [Muriicola jejuensis]